MKITDSQIRAYGLLMIVQYILNEVGKEIISTTQLKLKQQVRTIIENSEVITKSYESLQFLKSASSALNKDLSSEVINDEILTAREILKMTSDILISDEASTIYDLHLYLKNIKDGNRVFTQNEVDRLINEAEISALQFHNNIYE